MDRIKEQFRDTFPSILADTKKFLKDVSIDTVTIKNNTRYNPFSFNILNYSIEYINKK